MTTDDVLFREATIDDLPAIVEMLARDPLGAGREKYTLPLSEGYLSAFKAIDADPNNELIVASVGEQVIAVLQLTFIPNLTYQGSWRALVEGVRVAEAFRSQGVGRQLLRWAIDRAKARNCRILQLTTDKSRVDARRFYESLGFEATHEGMKLIL